MCCRYTVQQWMAQTSSGLLDCDCSPDALDGINGSLTEAVVTSPAMVVVDVQLTIV